MNDLKKLLSELLSTPIPASWISSIALILIGIPIAFIAGKAIKKFVSRHHSQQYGMIAGKVLSYGASILIIITVFHHLGFNLTPLLGAAGILGVALGFASQTSVSNIISGVFLIAEEPFKVGDAIEIGTLRGEILSVDLLSVKVRTFDNRLVRIPNESIIKTEIVNLTKFPIRRLDIIVSIAYKENIDRVRNVLLDVAKKNPMCLQEPEPIVYINQFSSSSIDLLFLVWTPTEHRLKTKSLIQEEVKERFDIENIEIPFPHMSFYTGSKTDPLPIKIIGDKLNT